MTLRNTIFHWILKAIKNSCSFLILIMLLSCFGLVLESSYFMVMHNKISMDKRIYNVLNVHLLNVKHGGSGG